MAIADEISAHLPSLPEHQQLEVLDFILFLEHRKPFAAIPANSDGRKPSFAEHPAFGLWKDREIDSVEYVRALRAEWEDRP
ncbi:MAG: DUF2281 domain-containing protein [Nitrospirae bacterium]|nr:DUF2281 domain-containing protein [Nitrospirota bacterium]